MSKLITETDEYVIIEEYVHHDSDEFSSWMMDSLGNLKYDTEFIGRADAICYELLVRAKVYKEDLPTEIIYVQDGGRKLT